MKAKFFSCHFIGFLCLLLIPSLTRAQDPLPAFAQVQSVELVLPNYRPGTYVNPAAMAISLVTDGYKSIKLSKQKTNEFAKLILDIENTSSKGFCDESLNITHVFRVKFKFGSTALVMTGDGVSLQIVHNSAQISIQPEMQERLWRFYSDLPNDK